MTAQERWGFLPFPEWKLVNQVYELVHSSRAVVEPEKPIPSPTN